jgi:hypothetical protein
MSSELNIEQVDVPEAAFYNEATANDKKSSFLKSKQAQVFLKTVTTDENAHVAYLKKALGSKAVAVALSILTIEARHASVAGLLLKAPRQHHPRRPIRHAVHGGGSPQGGRRDRLPEVVLSRAPSGVGDRPAPRPALLNRMETSCPT